MSNSDCTGKESMRLKTENKLKNFHKNKATQNKMEKCVTDKNFAFSQVLEKKMKNAYDIIKKNN